MLRRFFKNKWQRFVAAIAGIFGVGAVAVSAGGIVLTAAILVGATYFGTLITLSRIPETMPEDAGFTKRQVLKPLIKVRNFLFKHTLILTVALGFTVGMTVGITSVTGIVAMGLSALLGDLFVQVFKDGMEILKSRKKAPAPNAGVEVYPIGAA